MEVEELREIYKQSLGNNKLVNSYLKGRKLTNSKIKPFGYISRYKGEDFKIIDSLVLPILNLKLEIVGLECRSLKADGVVRYNKLFADDIDIPVYGLRSPNFTSDYCILTEGVFDAEFLQQKFKVNSLSTLRASVPNILLHYFALFFDRIIIAFDNDKAGADNARRIMQFYSKHYSDIETDVLEYKGKDINSSLISTVRKGLKDLDVL